MSLPAFSAIIANYVPNHGNIGPSGAYNEWVNKINTRKNACNSWATCTNTPDDIWNEKFTECDEGCSAQGDDKCVSNFCDALADVYDYTRRLEGGTAVDYTRRLEGGTEIEYVPHSIVDWYTIAKFFKDMELDGVPLHAGTSTKGTSTYDRWLILHRRAAARGDLNKEDLIKPFDGCPKGCLSVSHGICDAGSSFCGAMVRFYDQEVRGILSRSFPGNPYSKHEVLTPEQQQYMDGVEGVECGEVFDACAPTNTTKCTPERATSDGCIRHERGWIRVSMDEFQEESHKVWSRTRFQCAKKARGRPNDCDTCLEEASEEYSVKLWAGVSGEPCTCASDKPGCDAQPPVCAGLKSVLDYFASERL